MAFWVSRNTQRINQNDGITDMVVGHNKSFFLDARD